MTEQEVAAAVLQRHSLSAAEKFVQEVCWRTYWKGWLELRPSVWRQYRQSVDRARADLAKDGGLAGRLASAEAGATEIDMFRRLGRRSARYRLPAQSRAHVVRQHLDFHPQGYPGLWGRISFCAICWTTTPPPTPCPGAGSLVCKPRAKPISPAPTISPSSPTVASGRPAS